MMRDITLSFKRLKEQNVVRSDMSVLCLAARIGAEVKSFHRLGCFAVGIDLNPGKENRYVVKGDFHDIQFPENSVDVIFSNSFDHIFDLEKVLAEIRRVVRPGGLLVIEVSKGTEEGGEPRYYEALAWRNIDDLLLLISKEGFRVLKSAPFSYPWAGRHVSLKFES